MRNIATLFMLLPLLGMSQITYTLDTISTGPQSPNQVYYSLENGTVRSLSASGWDIAVATSSTDISLRINDLLGLAGTALWQTNSDTAGWATLDTTGNIGSWQRLYNSDSIWYKGAFEANEKGTVSVAPLQIDLGWGVYSPGGNATGDSLFVLRTAQGVYKKLWIVRYQSSAANPPSAYVIRYANLDGSGDTTLTIPKDDFTDRHFGYVSVDNNTLIDREPSRGDWDILFSRYTDDFGNGVQYDGIFAASLLNSFYSPVSESNITSVAAYPVEGLPYQEVTYNNVAPSSSSTYNSMAYSWRSMGQIVDSLSYFVSDISGQIWHVAFLQYSGAGDTVVIAKGLVDVSTGISSPGSSNVFGNSIVYPNPVTNQETAHVLFMLKDDIQEIDVQVYNMHGQLLQSNREVTQTGMNNTTIDVSDLPAGMYIVQLKNGINTMTTKVMIDK